MSTDLSLSRSSIEPRLSRIDQLFALSPDEIKPDNMHVIFHRALQLCSSVSPVGQWYLHRGCSVLLSNRPTLKMIALYLKLSKGCTYLQIPHAQLNSLLRVLFEGPSTADLAKVHAICIVDLVTLAANGRIQLAPSSEVELSLFELVETKLEVSGEYGAAALLWYIHSCLKQNTDFISDFFERIFLLDDMNDLSHPLNLFQLLGSLTSEKKEQIDGPLRKAVIVSLTRRPSMVLLLSYALIEQTLSKCKPHLMNSSFPLSGAHFWKILSSAKMENFDQRMLCLLGTLLALRRQKEPSLITTIGSVERRCVLAWVKAYKNNVSAELPPEFIQAYPAFSP